MANALYPNEYYVEMGYIGIVNVNNNQHYNKIHQYFIVIAKIVNLSVNIFLTGSYI